MCFISASHLVLCIAWLCFSCLAHLPFLWLHFHRPRARLFSPPPFPPPPLQFFHFPFVLLTTISLLPCISSLSAPPFCPLSDALLSLSIFTLIVFLYIFTLSVPFHSLYLFSFIHCFIHSTCSVSLCLFLLYHPVLVCPRALFLGLSNNPHITDLHLDISGCEVPFPHSILILILYYR